MTKIQLMPELLSNQIAAGEVIERPASVVKELVENAIDANSTQITVQAQESGLQSITVIDDGIGIPSDELALAFERHATNKLIEEEDLFRIRSLGFRGEALPSIASVAELTIESTPRNQMGKKLKLAGGMVVDESPASGRPGTKVRVENLFFNTPARLKYVKSQKTELSHITDLMNRFALSHPEISFHLNHQGNDLLKTVGNGDLRQAIAGVYGVSVAKAMKSIKNEDFNFKVSGYVSLPDNTRASNRYITLVVNGRPIKNYPLTQSIIKGYGSKLMVGRYPIAVIQVEMDPLMLDVNVHPTKHQIRISNEEDLGAVISEGIKIRLGEEVRIPKALDGLSTNRKPEPKEVFEQTTFNLSPTISNHQLDRETDSDEKRRSINQVQEDYQKFTNQSLNQSANQETNQEEINPRPFHVEEPHLKTAERTLEEKPTKNEFPHLDYIGQMHGTYLFAQNEEGLFIIDQHAAQERIKYEYFRDTIASQGTSQQNLLVPIVLEYPSNDYLTISENLTQLFNCGIYLEEFGSNTFVLRSHPSWFISGQEESTVKEMIDFLLTNEKISTKTFREATAIMMSCKRSIKANHHLSDLEARALIQDLPNTENPYNCPHGRPVVIQITNGQMEKMFKRIQDPH